MRLSLEVNKMPPGNGPEGSKKRNPANYDLPPKMKTGRPKSNAFTYCCACRIPNIRYRLQAPGLPSILKYPA